MVADLLGSVRTLLCEMYRPFDQATELMGCFAEAALALTDSPGAEVGVRSTTEGNAELRIQLGAPQAADASSPRVVFPIRYQGAELGWLALRRTAPSLGGAGLQACEWLARHLGYHLKRQEVAYLSQERHGREAALIGTSEPLSQVDLFLERASRTPLPGLILGGPGSDAESIALALHLLSPVRDGPFVQANCAALRGALFERRLLDLLCNADGGTLLLAHLEETDLQNQQVLWEALEAGPRLWTAGRRSRQATVRLLATAPRDLDRMAERGDLHSGLLEHLDVLRLEIEPLCNRREDIRPLIAHHLRRHAPPGGPPICEEVLQACVEYDWPGDVLELSRLVARLTVMSGEDGVLPRHVYAYAPQIFERRPPSRRQEPPRTRPQSESSLGSFLPRLDGCHPALRRAIDYITARPHAHLSLAQVAAGTHVSNSHLAHLFQKDLGTTFTRFLTALRIDRAKQLLLDEPREAISRIAAETGFSDLRHFERTFKGAVGCPPREFRRLAGAGRRTPAPL